MVNKSLVAQMVSDLNWVIAVTKSVESKDQLSISLKCYFLWEKKYKSIIEEFPNSKFALRGKFWAIYKNKESQFSVVGSLKS